MLKQKPKFDNVMFLFLTDILVSFCFVIMASVITKVTTGRAAILVVTSEFTSYQLKDKLSL